MKRRMNSRNLRRRNDQNQNLRSQEPALLVEVIEIPPEDTLY